MTYDGNAHTATGTATGVRGEDLSGLLNLSGTTHTNAGDFPSDGWSFSGNASYNPASGTVHDSIGKADPTVTVSGGGTFIYDGSPHAATATATGVKGENLTPVNVAYKDAQGNLLTSAPLNVGVYQAAARYAGDANYNQKQSAPVTITITQADATINVTGYTGIYDGGSHGASGTAKGVNNEDLSNLLSLGSSFANVPGGTANWSFAGNTNYKSASGSVTISISKADASCTVNGYTGIYDSAAHGASGSCTGIGGANLSASLSLGATFIDVPGGTAHWVFTGGTNYNDQSGDVAITINKAAATVNVVSWTGAYDTTAHGASGTATGVGGVDLSSGLNLGAKFTDVPGGTATWTFSGGINYADQTGDVGIVINKADQSIIFGGLSDKTAGDPAFTVSASAGSGLPVSFSSLTETICTVSGDQVTLTNKAGICTVMASQGGNDNYKAAADVNQSFTVNPAAAEAFSVSGPTATIAGAPLSVTVTAKDHYDNVATGYVGTVHFTSNDPNHAIMLPSDYTFGRETPAVTPLRMRRL